MEQEQLRVLMIDDSENEVMLILRELRKGPYAIIHQRVDTATAVQEALQTEQWDIILSDYVIPGFGGLQALEIVQAGDQDIPFLMISGVVSEEVAVEVMRAGANDFFSKGKLSRLLPAIERELRERDERQKRRLAEQRTALLQAMVAELSRAATAQEIAAVILRTGKTAMHLTVALVGVLVSHDQTVHLMDSEGLRTTILEEYRKMPLELAAPLTDAIRTGRAIWLEDQNAYKERYPHFTSLIDEHQSQAVVALPLMINDRILGGIGFSFAHPLPVNAPDQEFMAALANYCAQALDRAQLYEATRQQHEQLQVTLNSIGDAVIATDIAGYITFMNPVAEVLTGWYEEEAVGKPIDEVFVMRHEETHEPIDNPARRVLRGGKIVDLVNHIELIARDGRVFPIDDSGSPIRDDKGQLRGAIMVFHDVSDRRNRERAEREQRIFLESLHDSMLALVSSLELADVLRHILENIGRIIDYGAANILLMADDGTARVVGTRGYAERGRDAFEAKLKNTVFTIEESPLMHQLIETRRPVVLHDTNAYAGWVIAPEDARSLVAVPLIVRDQVIGFLSIDSFSSRPFSPQDVEHLQTFATQAAIAIYNAQLYEQSQQAAILEERNRLSRDLHDAVTQTLFSSSVIAEALPRLKETDPGRAWSYLDYLLRLNRGALAEMRNLLLELRPNSLTQVPMKALLPQLANAAMGRHDFAIHLKIEGASQPPPAVQVMFYRITQEALNNIIKHANANEVHITYTAEAKRFRLTITDDGDGFDINALQGSGLGLAIMRERAAKVGADFQLHSEPGQGTIITVEWRGEN